MGTAQKIANLKKKLGLKTGNEIFRPERLPTGIDSLDIITGGGFPQGRIVELYGNESTGKTLIALKTIAVNQKLGKVCVFVDAEKTFDKAWAEQQGVDIESLLIHQPESYGEPAIDLIKQILIDDFADIIILDSIEGLVPKAEIEASAEDVQVALKARMMNKAIRIWNTVGVLERKPVIICINQLRESLSKYEPSVTPGGKAMKFFATLRIALSRGKPKIDTTTKTKQSVEIRARTAKNKLSAEGKYGYWTMYLNNNEEFPNGYTDCTSFVITKAKELGIIDQKGKWFYYKDNKFDGKAEFVNYLYDNPEIYTEFFKKIIGDTIGHETEIKETGKELSTESEG